MLSSLLDLNIVIFQQLLTTIITESITFFTRYVLRKKINIIFQQTTHICSYIYIVNKHLEFYNTLLIIRSQFLIILSFIFYAKKTNHLFWTSHETFHLLLLFGVIHFIIEIHLMT